MTSRRKHEPNLPLTDVRAHFSFGENWASYAGLIEDKQIVESERGLTSLFGENGLVGRSFLDIGCGSGLHALAALRLGAAHVAALDIDPTCVATAEELLGRFFSPQNWAVSCRSVLEVSPHEFAEYDIVHAWGVLHHTGAMKAALVRAAELVKPGGLLAVALYQKTRMCGSWRKIKRWYSRASIKKQALARALYVALFRTTLFASGRSFDAYLKHYSSHRGMDYYHDVHDWLGGYPYESITAEELRTLMAEQGLGELRCSIRLVPAFGIFGSRCDEFVFARNLSAKSDPPS